MTARLLALLERPRTLPELARALGVETGTVRALLRQLEARGYVGLAYAEGPACGVACPACSMKRLCPVAGQATPEVPAYRLTDRGKRALRGKVPL